MDPPTITGSSTTPLNAMPACERSTSIACVRRTLMGVPPGTVTTLDAGAGAAGAAAAGWGAGLGAGFGAGGGAGLRAENSSATALAIGTSDTWPSSSSTRTDLLSAPMNMPSITFPDRSLTRSAESDTPVASTRSIANNRVRRVFFTVFPRIT